ncbi:hypothetical protein [Methanobrevibacter boviskoreani]|uniref:hypothetical protein n=1 Tax=Methanobrevibacter boviskoreani TaxID=1348249 RepID=UPI0012670682|nr:hypothetical protein [Methanobrevibacter boviskoreani]
MVNFDNYNFELVDFYKKESFDFNKYFNHSIFHNDFFISTDQRFMIPSKSHLLGLSPFFIKLDNDFLKNKKFSEKKFINFQKKIERSVKSNKNNKEFNAVLNNIYNDYNNFINSCPLNKLEKSFFLKFFNDYSYDKISSLIIDYYSFILEKSDEISKKIINLKQSEEFIKKDESNFYLACCFNNELDLINDIFIFYSKIFKKREEKIKNFERGHCSFCGKESITYSSIGSYALSKSSSFNYSNKMNNAHLRICNECNSYLRTAENNIKKSLNAPIMIIPKSKGNKEYSSFTKISNTDKPSFSKINEFLKDNSNDFNYDLIFYSESKGNTYIINKYVENYQAFLVEFNKKIKLYNEGNCCNYLLNEPLTFDITKEKNYITNLFDLEYIFKSFFVNINKEGVKYPNLFNFYDIYLNDISGEKGIFRGFDSKTVSIFVKYMNSIFSFIYELNSDSLNRKMLNEIVLNLLLKYQKNTNNENSYRNSIIQNLNYYYMLNKEFLEDKMLNEDNIKELKNIFSKYNIKNNDQSSTEDEEKKISAEDEEEIFKLIEEDCSLKYYLLGQFISLIDNFKRSNNKNGEVFSNFILNCNKYNVLKLFATEVLQKNNYYIEKMNKKGKFIFKILEKDLNSLFDEDEFYFEDYLLLIFTGYYTENILSSSYGSE